MELAEEFNLSPLTRQEALRVWLSRQGLTFAELARRLDLTTATVSTGCDAGTMPTQRHAQLVALGVPKELLPEPLDIKPGPKPKGSAQAEAGQQG